MSDAARHENELWHEFHRVVNMSPDELAGWLRTRPPGPGTASLPQQTGTLTGEQVLRLLSKSQADLTPDDLELMRRVIRRVRTVCQGNRESIPGGMGWRHRLMSLGHDPLKPS